MISAPTLRFAGWSRCLTSSRRSESGARITEEKLPVLEPSVNTHTRSPVILLLWHSLSHERYWRAFEVFSCVVATDQKVGRMQKTSVRPQSGQIEISLSFSLVRARSPKPPRHEQALQWRSSVIL